MPAVGFTTTKSATARDSAAPNIAQTRAELLRAISELLDAGRAAGELRDDITAEDIAASLVGTFTVAQPPAHREKGQPAAEHADGWPTTTALSQNPGWSRSDPPSG